MKGLEAIERRIAKLEIGRLPVPTYVVRLTHDEFQLGDAERRAIIRQRGGGRVVAVMPMKCADWQEWRDRYAKH